MRISFVGDIMCEKEQLSACKTEVGYDFTKSMEQCRDVFNKSDFSVANLETPLAGEDLGYTNHKWSFNSPLEFAEEVKKTGFNLVSTANNHCLDRGVKGAFATINNLKSIQLDQVGLNASSDRNESVYIKDINGLKIAFISYTYGTNATFNKNYLDYSNDYLVNLYRDQESALKPPIILNKIIRRLKLLVPINKHIKKFKRDILTAKSQADFVFVLMHSGGQYNLIPDKWTIKLMNYTLKLGVDVVIGCHPHVVQPGLYFSNNQAGFYSLGNFLSYPGSEASGMIGFKTLAEYSIILHIHINEKQKKIQKITFEIAKTIVDESDKIAKTILLYDLIENQKDELQKKQLINDCKIIASRFLDIEKDKIEVRREYDFPVNID